MGKTWSPNFVGHVDRPVVSVHGASMFCSSGFLQVDKLAERGVRQLDANVQKRRAKVLNRGAHGWSATDNIGNA